jgi:hypothetical protein
VQLVRQMLAESLVIAAVGTLGGVALARAGVQLLLALGPRICRGSTRWRSILES